MHGLAGEMKQIQSHLILTQCRELVRGEPYTPRAQVPQFPLFLVHQCRTQSKYQTLSSVRLLAHQAADPHLHTVPFQRSASHYPACPTIGLPTDRPTAQPTNRRALFRARNVGMRDVSAAAANAVGRRGLAHGHISCLSQLHYQALHQRAACRVTVHFCGRDARENYRVRGARLPTRHKPDGL